MPLRARHGRAAGARCGAGGSRRGRSACSGESRRGAARACSRGAAALSSTHLRGSEGTAQLAGREGGASQFAAACYKTVFFLRVAAFEVKVWAAAVLHIAHYDHFSPTYRVPTDTSRAKSGGVSSAQTTTGPDLCVAGRTGPNAAGIMPKVHDM